MIYLDHSATTPPSESALAAMTEAARVWGNPSSVHAMGREAAALLEKSRAAVAKSLGLPKFSQDKVFFTACGTESNNIALLGCAAAKKRDPANPGTILLSAGEHPSMENPAALLEKQGYTVVRIPTKGGVLSTDAITEALGAAKAAGSPVIFAGFMLVNNETGALYDVKKAASLVKAAFPDAVVHCDAVQGYMKTPFTPAGLGVDTLTVSAHKINSIRGAAALYVSAEVLKRRNLTAVMPGGGQESGLRSGTENLVSIAAFAAAAEEGRLNFDERRRAAESLRARLDERLGRLESLGVRVNRPEGASIPHICSVVCGRMRSETVLNDLSGHGICVSAGSACSAHAKKKSAALEAFGVPADEADSVIRVSLSYLNTADDIDAFADALETVLTTRQQKR